MRVKEHYDKHLGNFYSWMAGDFQTKVKEFHQFLNEHHLAAAYGDVAVDLGAGNGIQSLALAESGFDVIAIDFNRQLLDELIANTRSRTVTVINDDIRNFHVHARNVALICCCGDTITHLDNLDDIAQLTKRIFAALKPGGHAIFSFRDYSLALQGSARFIPVKSDDNRILTCVLDYHADSVTVTDLLHERVAGVWRQSVSSYEKVRLDQDVFIQNLGRDGFVINLNKTIGRMITVLASRPSA